jgi:hypothetical protein
LASGLLDRSSSPSLHSAIASAIISRTKSSQHVSYQPVIKLT